MYKSDLVIIGAGAAGLSAALYGVRAGLSVSVIYLDSGALGRAHLIENYFGFAEPVSGQALLDATTANLRRLGCRFKSGEVVAVNMTDNGFSVTLADGALDTGTAVLIATGRPVSLPPIPGIGAFEGNGVSHCAVCDGFFYRGKQVAVLGSGAFARAEAAVLQPLAASVTILTNGETPDSNAIVNAGFAVCTKKITSVLGSDKLTGIAFADGSERPLDGLFLANGKAGALDFAAHLGILQKDGAIRVDASGMTNLPGLFAAGDCLGAPYQVSVSVGRGCVAALGAVAYVRERRQTAAGNK